SPAAMMRAGLSRDTLKKGMPVSIYSSPAKFASTSGLPEADEAWKSKHLVLGGCITLPDGTKTEYVDGPQCKRPAADIVIGNEPTPCCWGQTPRLSDNYSVLRKAIRRRFSSAFKSRPYS